jgi:hypothetical protein
MSAGFSNLLWFVGVVEYREDASNDGRVKVRAFGIHNSDKNEVGTDDLPWAIVIDGSYGASSSIPDIGEWVFGFFMDGADAQHPMILGRIPGVNLQLPPEAGAPNEVSMIPTASIHKFGKPPLHRAIGGEDADVGQATLQQASKKNNIETALGALWSEPSIMTPERNLDNRVYTSKNDNNFVVLSDSEDGEGTYILVSHKSGSAVQIDSQGTVFVKSQGDTYNSSEGFTLNRTKHSHHTNVEEGDWDLKVENGSGKIWISGDLDVECENFNVTARNTMNLNAGTAVNVSGGKVGLFATADDINLAANANIKMKAGSNPLTLGGIYAQALFGDVHIDSYKMNLYSTAYTKITSLGTPAVSLQTLPYPDLGHKGVEINSGVLVHVTAPSVSVESVTALVNSGKTTLSSTGIIDIFAGGALNMQAVGIANLHAGGALNLEAVGVANLKATGILNLESTVAANLKAGGMLNLEAIGVANLKATGNLNMDGALVNIGMTTGSAGSALAATLASVTSVPSVTLVATLRNLQIPTPAAIPSITEIARVVNPGEIPASRMGAGPSTGGSKATRRTAAMTSRMTDDTTDGGSTE